MTAAMLQAERLYRFFHTDDEEVVALRDVSMTVAAGEIVVVRGPSGSGKSTLLACLCGEDDPDGGTVTVGGIRLSRRAPLERARLRSRSVGYMSQEGNLFSEMSIGQNIAFVQRIAGEANSERQQRILETLGIASVESHTPLQLSGGELARASLAVAMANDPKVLIADEPTGELDGEAERNVLSLFRQCASDGLSVVVASHSAAVDGVADRVLNIVDGSLRD